MLVDWFYSDPHFGHRAVIRYCDRPFQSEFEMNIALINVYNNRVRPNDTVLWVGDCFFMTVEDSKAILKELNGHKILVVGNHDRSPAVMARLGFDLVLDRPLHMNIYGHPARVSHYPYRDAAKDRRYHDRHPERRKGEVLIHGHTHNKRKRNGNMIHVGVDAWDYGPAPLGGVSQLVKEVFK